MKIFTTILASIALPVAALAQAPAAPLSADPPTERVAQARALLDLVMPESRMKAMMDGMTKPMFQGMMQQMLQGKTVDEARKADKYFDERINRTTKVLQDFMTSEMTDILPDMKKAMVVAYARQFTGGQLTDLGTFFRTPSGQAYLDGAPKLMGDPALIDVYKRLANDMRERRADLVRQIKAATNDLPPPPKSVPAPSGK
jgi:hypothetical protein